MLYTPCYYVLQERGVNSRAGQEQQPCNTDEVGAAADLNDLEGDTPRLAPDHNPVFCSL